MIGQTAAGCIAPLTMHSGLCNIGVMPIPTSKPMLRDAQRASERDDARASRSRAKRDALVADAVQAGWSHAQIAAATGLTRGRIGQIASRSKGDPTP